MEIQVTLYFRYHKCKRKNEKVWISLWILYIVGILKIRKFISLIKLTLKVQTAGDII